MPDKYSLIVPSWYPTTATPVNGIFVQKHVHLISQFTKVQLLYAAPAPAEQTEKFKITEQTRNNIPETLVYYNESTNKTINQLLLLRAFQKGVSVIIKKHGLPSVIHNHVVFPAGFFALFISIFYRIPLLITEHWTGYSDDDGRYAKLSTVHHFIICSAFKRAKGISVISAFLKNVFVEKKLAEESRVFIAGNVLNPPSALPTLKPVETNQVKAICVCNLDDNQKNISGLIDAVAEVTKQFPSFMLTLLGNGPDHEWLKEKTKQLNLSKNIFFAGSVPNKEVSAYYRNHHFFILNSNFETFSIATAEAIINGLPVVVTKCGGPEEFVNDTNGILVEKRNTPQLTKAILKMIETHSKFDSNAIAKTILSRYSNYEVTEKMKQLYKTADL